MKPVLFALSCALLAMPALAKSKDPAPSAAPNTLTSKEKAAGWKLLFDGKTTKGWRSFKSAPFPAEHWVAKDGVLECVGGKKVTDIVTEDEFDNFEFAW